MFQKIKQKLNSKRGASLVLALFLLLVCSFSGAAALTAASANAGRFEKRVKYQQQYLSVSSAANLIIDEINRYIDPDKKLKFYRTESGQYGYGETAGEEPYPEDGLIYAICDIKALLDFRYNAENSKTPIPPPARDLTITVADNDCFDKVTAHLEYREAGENVNFKLSCGDYAVNFDVGIETDYDESTKTVYLTFNTSKTEIRPGNGS